MISSELGEGQMVETGQEEEGSENESGREKNLRKGPETGSWDVLQFSFCGMVVKSSSGNSNWKGTQGKTLRNHCIVLSSNLIEFLHLSMITVAAVLKTFLSGEWLPSRKNIRRYCSNLGER